MICEKEGFDLVRAAFPLRHRDGLELIKLAKTRITKIHIQLCVRNVKIISCLEEYSVRRIKIDWQRWLS